MRKQLFFVLTVVLLLAFKVQEVRAQDFMGFQEKTNLVLFSGIVDKTNSPNLGCYYGTYLDYRAFKSANDQWSFGPFLVVSRSDSRYSAENNGTGLNKNADYGGGISGGYYNPEISWRYQSYVGASAGLSYGQERQEVTQSAGVFTALQKDVFLNLGLNFNLLKSFGLKPDLLPRSQLQFRYKLPIKSSKVAYWNKEEVSTSPWNRAYLEVIGKQNIFQAPLNWRQEIFYAPKLIALYNYQAGDARSFYGLGAELSLRREYRDDFFTINVVCKGSQGFQDNYWIVGLNFNLSTLLKR
jgi:hypothetical protein